MAEIKDCIGKNVKISKGSITIKSEDGKTSGVVRNITSLYDLQANMAVSRAMDPILDEADPIDVSYRFEVCSAGLERTLKRPGDFQQFLGSPVTVKLYRPYNGLKELPAVLRGYEDGKVTVEMGKETITFEKSQVALVRLRVEF